MSHSYVCCGAKLFQGKENADSLLLAFKVQLLSVKEFASGILILILTKHFFLHLLIVYYEIDHFLKEYDLSKYY